MRVRLDEHERLLLGELLDELGTLLEDPDNPELRRLFPPAYADAENDREYQELMRGQLQTGRKRALEVLESTVDQTSLSDEEADAWLRALNDARLVLGTELDVDEDLDWDGIGPDDPHSVEYAVYGYLSWIQEQLVAAAER